MKKIVMIAILAFTFMSCTETKQVESTEVDVTVQTDSTTVVQDSIM